MAHAARLDDYRNRLNALKTGDGTGGQGTTGGASVKSIWEGLNQGGTGGASAKSIWEGLDQGGTGGTDKTPKESIWKGLDKAGTSGTVAAAQNYLKSVINGGSGSGGGSSAGGNYGGDYSGQIADLYNQIMNRPKFSYDPNTDPLYNAYRQQYMQNGQLAMRDAMGTAAGLTGGYGNSWGDTAGFQAYQAYLQALNGVLPELEQTAYGRYQDEMNELLQNYSLSKNHGSDDYSQYVKMMGDWMSGTETEQQEQTEGAPIVDTTGDSLPVRDADTRKGRRETPLTRNIPETSAAQGRTLLDQSERNIWLF